MFCSHHFRDYICNLVLVSTSFGFFVEEKLEEKGSTVAEFVVSLYGRVPASVSRHLMETLLAFLTVG